MKTALIVHGGWDGHEPRQVAELLANALGNSDFRVSVADSLDAFLDLDPARPVDLIVPVWTMGSISGEQLKPLLTAVRAGAGLAGCHGGMCDAFRNEPEYQFMTGGQWVAHPGNDGRHYRVKIVDVNPITDGLADFDVVSEKYYLHVDPAIRVLATTNFEDYADTLMPVAWTKTYGRGRVFYCSLGHHADIVGMPQTMTLMGRGMRWAAGEWRTEMGLTFAQAYAANR
ncbi:MAG: ThuA domain-containing protein [Thermoflexales bacterium]